VLLNSLIHKIESAKNNIYIKREDLIPISFGGNKARKALKWFEEIDAGNFDAVVTYGSSSSNHCRVVANMSVARNLPCYIIGPEESSKITFNSKMIEWFGAEVTIVPVQEIHETIENKLHQLRVEGKNPYFILGGGHGNIGTEAFVECYEEIRQYEQEKELHFDYIFFASGTGTTQAGLVCGQLLNQDDRQIVGISIARKKPYGRNVVLDSICEYLQKKDVQISKNEIEKKTIFEDVYIGDGYAHVNEVVSQTIKDVMLQYGIPLDATYTGKAFWGMQEYIKANDIKDKNILFIHTGGTPLFFDTLEKF